MTEFLIVLALLYAVWTLTCVFVFFTDWADAPSKEQRLEAAKDFRRAPIWPLKIMWFVVTSVPKIWNDKEKQ